MADEPLWEKLHMAAPPAPEWSFAPANSSAKKATAKAGTPNRSTTSSTTEPASRSNPTSTGHDEASDPPILTSEQQESLLQLLAKGASPAGACHSLHLPIGSYLRTRAEHRTFRLRESQTFSLLTQNVMASLYQAAMKGSVPAMTAWLKWQPAFDDIADASHVDPLEELSDDELVDLARAMGVAVSHEPDAPPAPAEHP